MLNKLVIKGAREHNLKNIDLSLDKDKLIVISGLSGSGKSSLAFDTIFAEGQRRYVESLSAYARMFLGRMEKPDVDYMEGLSPRSPSNRNQPTRIPVPPWGPLRKYSIIIVFSGQDAVKCTVTSVAGRSPRCPGPDHRCDFPPGENGRIMVSAPVAIRRKGEYKKTFEDARKAGFQRAKVDGSIAMLDEPIQLDKQVKHTIDIVVDRLILKKKNGNGSLAPSRPATT